MAIKKIEDRVKESISGIKQEYFDDYLKAILENSYRTDEKMQRSIVLLLFFVATFELITRASISEASIGPFKLTDLSLIHKFLPLLIAYFYCSVLALAIMRNLLGTIYQEGLKNLHKPVYDNDLELLVGPASPLLVGQIVETYSAGKISKLAGFLTSSVFFVLVIGPIAFEIYAFYRCFLLYGSRDISLWLSLLASLVFLLEALLIAVQRSQFD